MVRTETAIRAIADDLIASETHELPPLLHRTVDRLDGAPDLCHNAIFRLLLVELCGTVVRAIHIREPSTSCACHATAVDLLVALTRLDDADPRLAFWMWVERFVAHASAQHPPTPAQAAAALMRAQPSRGWTLRDLAHRVGVLQGHVSREFEKTFGLRPSEYVHLVRVAQVVPLFRTPAKVDVIASDAGYRSKKDFYAALKRWTGLTPTELRGLRDDESDWLAEELRRRSRRTAPTTRDRHRFVGVYGHGPTDTPECRPPRLRPRSAPPPRT